MTESANDTNIELREALKQAKQTIVEQDEFLQKLTKPPCGLGIVLKVEKESTLVAADSKILQVETPPAKLKIAPGDTVTIVPDSMQIAKVVPTKFGGSIAVVKRMLSDGLCEVGLESGTSVVFLGSVAKVEKGDRVLVDRSGFVLTDNFGKDEESFHAQPTGVTWDDIGGLEHAKQQMIEVVEFPHRHPELFAHYNKKPSKGVLMFGPPGCGKTLIAKAAATALQKIYAGKKGTKHASTGFFYVKGPEILDPYVGVAEGKIRGLFARAREHKAQAGFPSVIFIDEADAVLNARGSGRSSDIERTIVPMFLTEMDGLEESGALVILATNRPDTLDPAVIRDGRVDRKIKITRPDQKATAEIFRINLSPLPLANGYTHASLAQEAAEQVFLPSRRLSEGKTLKDIVSGAMVANIVDHATSQALRRDIQAKKRSGLSRDDLLTAIEIVESQDSELTKSDDYLRQSRDRAA